MAKPNDKPLPSTGKCLRCGIRCRVAGGSDPKARLLQLSETATGFCINCGVADFMRSTPVLADIIERNGVQGLRHWTVQAQFAAVMKAGGAQVVPDQIDWLEVIANWELPWPKPRGRRKTKH